MSLVGDILSLRQRNGGQVVVEGNLGVTKNVVIAGGLHVEGELCANHLTLPKEIQATEQTTLQGAPTVLEPMSNTKGKILGFGVPLSNWPVPTVNEFGTVAYKPGTAGVSGPPYIGFTDATIPCGRLQVNTTIGYIKADLTVGYIPTGTCNVQGVDSQGATVICTNITPIEVKASRLVTGGLDVPILASNNGSSVAGFDTPVFVS